MAGSLSNYAENKVLDHVLGTTSYTKPTTYVALYTVAPTDSTAGTEVTGGSYARLAGAFDASVKYSQELEQFGQPISNFQGISFKLADMAMQIEAAELLTLQAADLKNRGEKMTKQSAFAKYYASEVAVRCSTEAVQIFGGYGYTKDFPVEKFYRDSKLCTIGEGTSEIQKLVIARNILSA
jgi:alkylation response protein AidB-like acyl-CoA dehydrogenase